MLVSILIVIIVIEGIPVGWLLGRFCTFTFKMPFLTTVVTGDIRLVETNIVLFFIRRSFMPVLCI